MKWTLRPLDDSIDLILVTDSHDTALAAVHIDAFNEGIDGGKIYQRLFRGEMSVEVEVRLIDDQA